MTKESVLAKLQTTVVHEQPPSPRAKGLVQVFTGNGKGKTSAAMGAVLRAVGHGLRAYIVHFMKGQYPYGEQNALAQLSNVTIARFGSSGFVDPENVTDEEKLEARRALEVARDAILSSDYELVVLDEINVALAWKLLELDQVIDLIQGRPENVELILTGRHADTRLIELADLVTEMTEVKHPYSRGIKARPGFEY